MLPANDDITRMAISQRVMQHIPAAAAPQFVSNSARLLVEGGLGIHSICIVDLLSCYDRSASPKQYLTYSESQWRLWCENSVQHHNRIQRSEWLRMFTQAGFSLVEESGYYAELTGLRIHPDIRVLARRTSSVWASTWLFGKVDNTTFPHP